MIVIYDENNYLDRYYTQMSINRSVEKVSSVSSVKLRKENDSKEKKKKAKDTNQFRNIYNEKVNKKI